ncbi:MAG: DNA primase [Lachnospiraceae bacterium]|nr:DNA primase [Lachnospiraceae bacterium]
MAWISPETKEEILNRIDIVDIIGSSVNLKRTGSTFTGLCPFHNEKTPSFSVNPNLQIYKCFGCNASGNVITFLMDYEKMTYIEAMEYLAERAGVTIDNKGKKGPSHSQDEKEKLMEINKQAALFYYKKLKSEEGSIGYKYFKERGLSDETIRHFGLGFSGKSSGELYSLLKGQGYNDKLLEESGLFKFEEKGVYEKFWNRVMFPIMDRRNHVIGFGGRVMSDVKPKYLNSPENMIFLKRKNLFGLNYALKSRKKYYILCEGYMDVIALHQAGFDSAVASLGTAFTEEQAQIMKRFVNEVLLTYDSDEAGVRAAMRAIPILRNQGLSARVINLEPYKDPDEFIKAEGSEAFEERIKKAKNGFIFQAEVIKSRYNLTDPDERTRFINEISELICDVPDEIARDSYIKTSSTEYAIDLNMLKRSVTAGLQKREGRVRKSVKTLEERKSEAEQKKKETGINKSYALIISWLIKEPKDYEFISKWIGPEDFINEDYKVIAEKIFDGIKNGNLDVKQVIGEYENIDDQKSVASMIQSDFDFSVDDMDKEKSLKELIYNIKQTSLEYRINNEIDPKKFKKLIEEKGKILSILK